MNALFRELAIFQREINHFKYKSAKLLDHFLNILREMGFSVVMKNDLIKCTNHVSWVTIDTSKKFIYVTGEDKTVFGARWVDEKLQ